MPLSTEEALREALQIESNRAARLEEAFAKKAKELADLRAPLDIRITDRDGVLGAQPPPPETGTHKISCLEEMRAFLLRCGRIHVYMDPDGTLVLELQNGYD